MRICIVCFANIRVMPFIHNYTNILKENNLTYDIILWNRSGLKETYDCNKIYKYNKIMKDDLPLIKKFPLMLSFANYANIILKKNKYDYIIMLTSLPAVMQSLYLLSKAKRRYILDIRDYTYERIPMYKFLLYLLMKNSLLNVVSSKSFVSFLPYSKVLLNHNCPYEGIGDYTLKKNNRVIHVSFVGLIRFADEVEKFLDQIKNDNRFIFDFYGTGTDENRLKNYCEKNEIKNVNFYGAYSPDMKSSILEQSDILFNAYGTQLSLRYAISNKYYDALYYKKPLIVCKGTSMETNSEGISFAVEYKRDVSDKLYHWYHSLDENTFNERANTLLKEAIQENKRFNQTIEKKLLRQ